MRLHIYCVYIYNIYILYIYRIYVICIVYIYIYYSVLKTYRQTSSASENTSSINTAGTTSSSTYIEMIREIVAKDGWSGLFGRGLQVLYICICIYILYIYFNYIFIFIYI